jgi:hypothetical protein
MSDGIHGGNGFLIIVLLTVGLLLVGFIYLIYSMFRDALKKEEAK